MFNPRKSLLFIILCCTVNFAFSKEIRKRINFRVDNTQIKFNLKAGSQLFITYPLNIFENKDLLLPIINTDTTVIINVSSSTPFTLINSNKIRTHYLFFPNLNYSIEVKENQSVFEFLCEDSLKQFECNILNKLQNSVGKFDIGNEDKYFNLQIKERRYSKALDSFYTIRKNHRLNELLRYKSENKISDEGFEILTKYVEFAFIRNRFLPFYDNRLEKNTSPDWYKDTMQQYINVFNDTMLLNTSVYKSGLRCMNLFLSNLKEGNDELSSQFSIAKQFSNIIILNEMLMFYAMNSEKNKKDNLYSNYLDSLKLYSKNYYINMVITKNYEFKKSIKKESENNFLVSSIGEIISFDSLVRNQRKIVVVDFWASWCLPCLNELKLHQNSSKKYLNENISYVFISMDEDYHRWKLSSEDFPFMNNSNSFILKNGFKSNLAELNRIQSIPFYMIYKNDGTILRSNIDNIHSKEFDMYLHQIL